jgi:CheY-like chemotaxis protein
MPNLVVLDRMMPKMDGIKACALLKSDRRFCRLPIIMATASAEKADQEISREVGVDAYINKPLNMVELMEKVQLLVNRV